MRFVSTGEHSTYADLNEAVFSALAPGGGLYLPETINRLDAQVIESLKGKSLAEVGYAVLKNFLGEQAELSNETLESICRDAFNFQTPLTRLGSSNIWCLELFHGPSYAFKDFGARFMSRLMQALQPQHSSPLHILVATSGDTGGAVALGFLRVPGIKVHILYPKGKVSLLQEKQLTTCGYNIQAYEIDGSFDDCQAIVKACFADEELNKRLRLGSANSINLARMLPQAVYYAWSSLQFDRPPVFAVPCGNFGNLCAGIMAQMSGFPIQGFVVGNNANHPVIDFLKGEAFEPKPAVPTISNAMDVGNPSNFPRILKLYADKGIDIRQELQGFAFTDAECLQTIEEVWSLYGYLMEPHATVAYLTLKSAALSPEIPTVFLGTAHPAKFMEVMPAELRPRVSIPKPFADLAVKQGEKKSIGKKVSEFTDYLLKEYV